MTNVMDRLGCIASPKSNQGLCSIGSRLDLLKDFQRKLARAMVPGSHQLAIAPPAFLRGRPVFSSSCAVVYGFAVVYIFPGRGSATHETCRRCSVGDWPPARTGFAPTPLQRGPCGCAANPAHCFPALALGPQ